MRPVAHAVLLLGPTVLAFFSGGFFTGPRLVAGVAAWLALALLLALGRPRARLVARLPRAAPPPPPSPASRS